MEVYTAVGWIDFSQDIYTIFCPYLYGMKFTIHPVDLAKIEAQRDLSKRYVFVRFRWGGSKSVWSTTYISSDSEMGDLEGVFLNFHVDGSVTILDTLLFPETEPAKMYDMDRNKKYKCYFVYDVNSITQDMDIPSGIDFVVLEYPKQSYGRLPMIGEGFICRKGCFPVLIPQVPKPCSNIDGVYLSGNLAIDERIINDRHYLVAG